MKFRITFKDPDGVANAMEQMMEREYPSTQDGGEAYSFIEPWVKYSEYITVEFDTKKGTAEVIKND